MTTHDLFAQKVSIRLTEDQTGFVYTISYGGLPIRRDYVSIFHHEWSAPETDEPVVPPKRSTGGD